MASFVFSDNVTTALLAVGQVGLLKCKDNKGVDFEQVHKMITHWRRKWKFEELSAALLLMTGGNHRLFLND